MSNEIAGHVYYEYLNNKDADLFTVVCRPDKNGKYPTVITRSPYVDDDALLSEEKICENRLNDFQSWIERGYVVIIQHCRGCGKSTGDCVPYIYEREDGLFLQAWVRQQDFYNGEIYLVGSSYTAAIHYVTAPFADDIKGAVLRVKDTERYNCNYRNGFYKMGLHGGWYVDMYKKKTITTKNYTPESYNMLPLSNFSKTVFGESAEDFDEILKHPNHNDNFWDTRYGGGETRGILNHANIPILLMTGFYDIFTGGIFDMWNAIDDETKAKSALAVHPFNHDCSGELEPVNFENGDINKFFPEYDLAWLDYIRGKEKPPFELGKITYYKVFGDKWCCDDFYTANHLEKIVLGDTSVTYKYDPQNPAVFKGGLSANFGGNAWQDAPDLRDDIITIYTPEFNEDTFVKGKIKARLKVKSDCEDTCFYIRISLCKAEGDYGLRDDINQISNFCNTYVQGSEITMDFSFDEHAFIIKKGEKIRIDISSSAFPLYVRHTNNKGLFSELTTTKIANNTVVLSGSYIELPIEK